MSTIIPEPPPEPTYHARVSFPPGLDETRLAVVDNDAVIAETTWRHSSHDMPGPAVWDWHLHSLHYDRRSPWQRSDLGFEADVEPITRERSTQ
ncbi:MAG TPA: hypothetical protein VFR62_01540 [Gemmatimonadales bacterium]|nr:hypothetical protein [Gemmatimonadales bacterium]